MQSPLLGTQEASVLFWHKKNFYRAPVEAKKEINVQWSHIKGMKIEKILSLNSVNSIQNLNDYWDEVL